MKKIQATGGPLTVASGEIELTAQQARARVANLKPVKVNRDGGGIFLIVEPIQFKAGETFGYDGHVGKDGTLSDPDAEQLASLEVTEAAVKKAVAATKADCEARIATAVADAEAALLAKLKPETAALVRAELHPKAQGVL